MVSIDLSTRECGGRVMVALRGELDVLAAASVAAAVAAATARDRGIIIDLADLDFIDCGGLRALAEARDQARRAAGDLPLAAPQQQVLRVITLTGLAGVFSVHASAEQAAGGAARYREDGGYRAAGVTARDRHPTGAHDSPRDHGLAPARTGRCRSPPGTARRPARPPAPQATRLTFQHLQTQHPRICSCRRTDGVSKFPWSPP